MAGLVAAFEHERELLDYEVDGAVVKVEPLRLHGELGVVGGREPRWATAYKYAPDLAETTLLDIGINVGRTGALDPYAILEPVEIGGVTVRLATLHNEEDIQRKDIRIGERVLIKRAGEVIPQVLGPVLTGGAERPEPFRMPEECPVCRTQVERPTDEVMIYCPNSACPARIFRGLEHFSPGGAQGRCAAREVPHPESLEACVLEVLPAAPARSTTLHGWVRPGPISDG